MALGRMDVIREVLSTPQDRLPFANVGYNVGDWSSYGPMCPKHTSLRMGVFGEVLRTPHDCLPFTSVGYDVGEWSHCSPLCLKHTSLRLGVGITLHISNG